MCDPVSLTTTVLAVAGSVHAHQEQKSAAKTQQQEILKSAELQNIQTAQVYDQQNQAAMAESSQRHIQWLQELGRLRTSGAESGLTGATENRLENEASMTAQQDMATIEANRLKNSQQTASTGVAQNRQATADLRSIKRPSLIGTGLQIAGAGVSGYSDHLKYKEAMKGKA